jgi:hypothetical protein
MAEQRKRIAREPPTVFAGRDPLGSRHTSPDVSVALDEPSIMANADCDILPWNIPVWPYLHGLEPHDARVSAADADLRGFPPTFGQDAAPMLGA